MSEANDSLDVNSISRVKLPPPMTPSVTGCKEGMVAANRGPGPERSTGSRIMVGVNSGWLVTIAPPE